MFNINGDLLFNTTYGAKYIEVEDYEIYNQIDPMMYTRHIGSHRMLQALLAQNYVSMDLGLMKELATLIVADNDNNLELLNSAVEQLNRSKLEKDMRETFNGE